MSYFPILRPKGPLQVGSLPEKKLSRTLEEHRRDFSIDQKVKNAILAGLGYFATGSVLEILVYFLEIEQSVDFGTVVANPKPLRAGLSAMFGSAEDVVETKICQALGRQFRIDIEGKSLEDIVSIIKSSEVYT
jgi:Na+-transporting methylmalonyl-CoA/oxaloacetate decarboxylase beta subunit